MGAGSVRGGDSSFLKGAKAQLRQMTPKEIPKAQTAIFLKKPFFIFTP
jgi:hypothetical protein